MVENKVLQWGLWQALAAHEAVTLRVGSELKTMQRGETQTALHLREGETIHARLVIGADGATSQVREMAGIGVHAWQYQQSCMLISVECADDPGDSTAAVYSQRPARLPAAVRPLGLAGLVRRPGADPSAAKHDHGAAPAGDRQSLSGAAGTGDAAGGRRLPAYPASCAAVCSARRRWWAMRRTPFIHWRGRGLTLAIVMSMPCWRSPRKRGRGEDWDSLPVLKRYRAAASG